MEKFDLNYNSVQTIEYQEKELITDFITYIIDVLQKEMLFGDFDNFIKNVTVDNVEKMRFRTWNITDKTDDFDCVVYLNDGEKRHLLTDYTPIIKWLEKHNLIEGANNEDTK